MKKVQSLIKNSRLNIFILVILFLLGFSLLYFLYYRQRNQAEVYVGLSVTRGINIPISGPYNWIPYWLADSINVGDNEISPLGGLNAVVLDKEIYEASFYGKNVYLLLNVNAIKDRSGIYLFKNKPLSVGATIDLKLTKAQIQGLVTYVGTETPKYQYKKLLVKVTGLGVEWWIGDAIKIGSIIKNNKGEEIAKVIGKKVSPASGSPLTVDRNKRDIEVTVEILMKKIDDIYYYAETQKVKVDENLFLPFKEGSLNFPIIFIEEIKETK